MSFYLIDGFDDGISELFQHRKWTNDGWVGIAVNADMPHGRSATVGNAYKDLLGSAQVAHIIVGFNMVRGENLDGEIIRLQSDAGTTTHVVLQQLYASGELRILRGSGGTTLGTTSGLGMQNDTQYHIELDVTLHDSTGSVVLLVDGNIVLNLTGIDTKNGGTMSVFDRVVVQSGQSLQHLKVDDFYIIVDDGVDRVTRIGKPSRILAGFPVGNGANSGMTGSDGNSVDNYLLTDEVTPNTSDYVGHATEGTKDTYPMTEIGTNYEVHCVRTALYAAKSDTGNKSIRPVIRSGGTDHVGATVDLSETYVFYYESWDEDPDTDAAWTPAGVNAMEVGAEVRNS